MFDIALIWDLNGVLFKQYMLDINTLNIVKKFNNIGISQYVCTNTRKSRLREYEQRYNIRRYFKKIYSTQHMGLIKTDPEVFNILRHEIGKSIVLIDDKRKNIQVASSMGIQSILYMSDIQLLNDLKLLGIQYDI